MILSGQSEKMALTGSTTKAKASAMTAYISDDDNFASLLKSITKRISAVMKSKDIGIGELRDFIKTETIQKEILDSFKSIKNPLSE